MFDNEIYEVTRDEFKGFIDQIKPECIEYSVHELDGLKSLRIFAKNDSERLFAEQVIKDEEVQYFVYEMPHDNERRAAKAIRKIVLESPEEVKAFFDILNKVQKEHKHD